MALDGTPKKKMFGEARYPGFPGENRKFDLPGLKRAR